MRRLIILLAVFLSAALPLSAKDPLRVVVDPWPPFGGEGLINGGISPDVITTVLERSGYVVETHIAPWERALEGAKSGTYDIVGNLFFRPELEEFLTYGDPFYDSEVHFLKRRDGTQTFHDLDSLRPYTIAVGAGYLYEDAFDAATYLDKLVVTTVVQGVRMVASGRVDLTLDSVDVLTYVIATEAPELKELVEILPSPLAQQSIHMAIRNDHPVKEEIRTAFNKVLLEMKNDGSLDDLLAKHKY